MQMVSVQSGCRIFVLHGKVLAKGKMYVLVFLVNPEQDTWIGFSSHMQ